MVRPEVVVEGSEVSMGQGVAPKRPPVHVLDSWSAVVTADSAVLPRPSSQLIGGGPIVSEGRRTTVHRQKEEHLPKRVTPPSEMPPGESKTE